MLNLISGGYNPSANHFDSKVKGSTAILRNGVKAYHSLKNSVSQRYVDTVKGLRAPTQLEAVVCVGIIGLCALSYTKGVYNIADEVTNEINMIADLPWDIAWNIVSVPLCIIGTFCATGMTLLKYDKYCHEKKLEKYNKSAFPSFYTGAVKTTTTQTMPHGDKRHPEANSKSTEEQKYVSAVQSPQPELEKKSSSATEDNIEVDYNQQQENSPKVEKEQEVSEASVSHVNPLADTPEFNGTLYDDILEMELPQPTSNKQDAVEEEKVDVSCELCTGVKNVSTDKDLLNNYYGITPCDVVNDDTSPADEAAAAAAENEIMGLSFGDFMSTLREAGLA